MGWIGTNLRTSLASLTGACDGRESERELMSFVEMVQRMMMRVLAAVVEAAEVEE